VTALPWGPIATLFTMPPTAPLGFCIVGCGMIARFHVRALAEVPGTRVAALVTRNPASAEKLIAETGLDQVPVYTDLSQALKRKDVHVVIVTTPSGAHLDPAVAAAKAETVGAWRSARRRLLASLGKRARGGGAPPIEADDDRAEFAAVVAAG